jgi:hypothetical protein
MKPDPPRDANTALVAADSFRAHANIFLAKIGRDMATMQDIAVRDIGGCVASATEMALAVELYLKALRTILGMKIPRSHDLWKLYRDFPAGATEAIEQHYHSRLVTTPWVGSALNLRVMAGPISPNEANAKPKATDGDNSIEATLKRNANAFITWRYLYEQGVAGQTIVLQYDFHRLETAGVAVRETAIKISNKQQQLRRAAAPGY